MTGSLPDPNLGVELSELVGLLRQQASIASRSGQYEDLNRLADRFLQWQKQLKRAFNLALGDGEFVTWALLVNRVAEVRHERDGAQQLHQMAADDLKRYDRQYTALRDELDEALEAKRGG